jgi:hypothetical protein
MEKFKFYQLIVVVVNVLHSFFFHFVWVSLSIILIKNKIKNRNLNKFMICEYCFQVVDFFPSKMINK